MLTLKFLLVACVFLVVSKDTLAIPGGVNDIEEDDTVRQIAQWTVDKMTEYTGIPGTYKVNKIKNIRAQVVAGKYYLSNIIYFNYLSIIF
jgi:hypothetical protein